MKSNDLIKEFLQYVALNVCGMLGLSCYILADTFFISNGLGADGLAALNLAIPVYSFVHGSGLMLGMGGATKYSIFRGQKEDLQAGRTFSNALCLGLILSFFFLLTGIFFSENLTLVLGAKGSVYNMTKTYLQVILLFSPAFIGNDILICFVRNDGDPKLSMAAMLTGSFANILLDYLFIFPLQMGILGAVLATGAAPVISLCILLWRRMHKKDHFHMPKPKFFPSLTKDTLSLGIPSLIAEMASGIVMIAFNFIILGLLGNTGVAAYGIIANLSLVTVSVFTGIAQGIQPVISRSYGRGDSDSIQKILKYGAAAALLLSGCIYCVFLFLADPIVSLFNMEQDMPLQQIAVTGMRLYFTAIPFAGFNIVLSAYFAATEKALPAQSVSLARGFFVILPVTFLLSRTGGIIGVWLAFPITEFLVAVIGVMLFYRLRPSEPNRHPAKNSSRSCR